jgi:hypothetical protein
MSPQPTLSLIERGPKAGELSVEQVWQQDGASPVPAGARHLVPLELGGSLFLLAVDGTTGAVTALRVQSGEPWFEPVPSTLDLGGPWDVLDPFVIGNVPHLLAYAKEEGQFSFFPLGPDLTSRPPYQFRRIRPPGETAGFDTVKTMVVNGAVYYLCYSFDTGTVNIYSLAVTATSVPSAPETPPLLSRPVWLHQWARSWTRFAFFQLGGATFFLKTNVGRLNVNIDHVLDDPSQGTIEVGSYLQMDDALEVDLCRPFTLGHGDPYFVNYLTSGKTTFNRFHGDCLGWDTEASVTTVPGATQVVPLQVGDRCLVLFC